MLRLLCALRRPLPAPVRLARALSGPSSSFSSSPPSSLLVINAGSSSLKYKLFALQDELPFTGISTGTNSLTDHAAIDATVGTPIFSGLVELSTPAGAPGRIIHKRLSQAHATQQSQELTLPLPSHRVALEEAVARFFGDQVQGIRAIGHRVVHGGERFHDASRITHSVREAIAESSTLAPLHNPANLLGIDVATEVFGESVPQVAVFDTAFHATMKPHAFTYAVPYELYETHGVRRYGFHGTSHQYVAQRAAMHLGKPVSECNFVTCHLGNGSSMAAIQKGQCIDTTMGLTPLEGLCMGTRSGDVDPALHLFLATQDKLTLKEIDTMLNKKSGLLGICGESDIRKIQDRIRARASQSPVDAEEAERQRRADLALDVFCHRVRKYLGAFLLELDGRVDGIVFTAGIGENSAMVRERVCRGLDSFLGGITLDEERNAAATMGEGPVEIQSTHSAVKVLAIPTDEERSIAMQTYALTIGAKE